MTEDPDRRAASEVRRMVDQHEYRLVQLTTVPGLLQDLDRRLADQERRIALLDSGLSSNTAITQAIRDAQIGGKVLIKLLTWVAGAVAAAGTIWGAIYQLTHGGKLP